MSLAYQLATLVNTIPRRYHLPFFHITIRVYTYTITHTTYMSILGYTVTILYCLMSGTAPGHQTPAFHPNLYFSALHRTVAEKRKSYEQIRSFDTKSNLQKLLLGAHKCFYPN